MPSYYTANFLRDRTLSFASVVGSSLEKEAFLIKGRAVGVLLIKGFLLAISRHKEILEKILAMALLCAGVGRCSGLLLGPENGSPERGRGLLRVQGGKERYCNNRGAQGVPGERFKGKHARWNFDSFPQAMQSVLVIFSYNGWQEILFSTMNAR